jgi:hypothetical protein
MEYILATLPHTPLSWTLLIVLSLLASLAVMSFVEYYLHGYVLHQRSLPAWVYRLFPEVGAQHYEHAILHHETYFKTFNYEPDPVGRSLPQNISLKTAVVGAFLLSPLMAVIFFLTGIVPLLVFIVVGLLYVGAWNLIHIEMHQPKHPWWSKLAPYRMLARYHYLHHDLHRQRIHRNINLVLPFADFILGTHATATAHEEEEMRRFGYLR